MTSTPGHQLYKLLVVKDYRTAEYVHWSAQPKPKINITLLNKFERLILVFNPIAKLKGKLQKFPLVPIGVGAPSVRTHANLGTHPSIDTNRKKYVFFIFYISYVFYILYV